MKKILFSVFLSLSLVAFVLPCLASAEQVVHVDDLSTTEGESYAQTPTANTTEYSYIENSNDKITTNGENSSKDEGEITTKEDGEDKLWSEELTETVEKYIGEIFCALTFLGSVVTAYLYKKGLLPTLGEGINKICSVVVSSGEKATDIQKENAELLDAFVEKAAPVLERANEISLYAEQMRKESLLLKDELERDKAQRKALSDLISGQIDLLYGVFMSASLPEYQKEQLGAQYNRLKSLISENGE